MVLLVAQAWVAAQLVQAIERQPSGNVSCIFLSYVPNCEFLVSSLENGGGSILISSRIWDGCIQESLNMAPISNALIDLSRYTVIVLPI
jgi:hypothetical protein